jgi:hypothetical protein
LRAKRLKRFFLSFRPQRLGEAQFDPAAKFAIIGG